MECLHIAGFRSDIALNFMSKEKAIFRFDNPTYTSQKKLEQNQASKLKHESYSSLGNLIKL